jgi:hypothetical protein
VKPGEAGPPSAEKCPQNPTLWVAFFALILFYAVLGLFVLAPEAVYSGDIGVKYVQARALANNRFTSLAIPYPGDILDSTREFFPIRPPFAMVANGVTQAIFPPVSATIQAVAVSMAGFRGLIALSVVSAGVVLFASWKLAPREYGLPVLVAVGLGGPLWFYAVSGWEHAPAVAFSTAAFACAVRSPVQWSAVLAGALLGAGASLRDEVILLFPGLFLAIWLRERRIRPVAAAAAAVLVPLALSAALELWWFERPAAAHLRHAAHSLQTAFRVTDEPNPDVPVLRPMTTRERYDTVVVYWLLGRGSDRQVTLFVGALSIALLVWWRWGSSIGILLWLLAFGATALGDLWEVLTLPKWLAGLVRVSPYVVFAVLPLARRGGDGGPLRDLWLVVGFTTAAYFILAFAGTDTSGGKSLGPRLLLPLLPLLTVSALVVIRSYLRSADSIDRLVGLVGVGFVLIAVAIHMGGTIRAYVQRNVDDSSVVLTLGSSPERIVVADDMFTAQLLFPLYYRKIILLADSAELGRRLGGLLDEHRFAGAMLVSRNPEPVVALAPLRLDRVEHKGRMMIQYWRR